MEGSGWGGGGGVRDINSARDHHPFFGAVGSRFNEELNTRRIKHVFRGLCPNFARDLLKAIRPCSVEIENVLGGSSRKPKCSRKPARRGMKDLGIHRLPTHTHTHINI